MTIGGEVYGDILIIDGTGFTNSRYYNKTIWYSKSQGVVQYADIYGGIWVRDYLLNNNAYQDTITINHGQDYSHSKSKRRSW
jgi:hypothetical protein